MRPIRVWGLSVLALTACGSPSAPILQPDRPAVEQPEPAVGGPQFDAPPPVTVRAGDKSFDLKPWTYCYDTGCADGAPPQNPPDLGQAAQVEIEFPLDGWTFEAEFVPAGNSCPRRQSVPVEQTGAGTYVATPAGVADTYDVTLFGRGDGDLFVTFRWTTPSDGPMPIPHARLAVLADHDGRVDSYGVELELSDLGRTPEGATAEVTVAAANGESLTFDASPVPQCVADGTCSGMGQIRPGSMRPRSGPAPFMYEVVVTLDGVEHAATATWPADQIPGNEPSVALEFSPPLPGLPARQ